MVDWSALTRRLQACDDGRLELSFAEIERIIGGKLPTSSQYPAFWSNSSSYAKAWRRAGFAVTRRGLLPNRIAFVRSRTADPPSPAAPPVSSTSTNRDMTPDTADVVLVGCVKTKADEAMPARDLYLSPMFAKRRAYAEATGRPWYVLSAKHGLLDTAAVIEPYDVYLADQSEDYRRAWGEWVAACLTREMGQLRGRVVEIHAGSAYVDAIEGPLRRRGAVVVHPVASLRHGEQLAWYVDQPPARAATTPPADGVPPKTETAVDDLVVLDGPHEVGPFTFRWPDAEEDFDRGWDLDVAVDGKRRNVRHGLTFRRVYGAMRRRSITLIDGAPVAEAVGPDDYNTSRCLISALKDEQNHIVRPGAHVPAAYAGFPLVSHREQIDAPYSRDALAVRLHEDDITSWVGFALARSAVRAGRQPTAPAPRPQAQAAPTPMPEPTSTPADSPAVVAALLAYGRSQTPERVGETSFTPHPEANALILNDPFAFLLAVIFDQGIPAERAWRAPYELMQRLGHLDPARLAADEAGVYAAVNQPPVLHRYREKLPPWLVAAARLVLSAYAGDVSRIWSDEPTAAELQRRLDRFPGIGQKKAAMAVEILERDLGVPIRDLHGSDIAYDVHVRRVFLRTGLADYDDLDHMLDVARRAHPERPGAIDFPAWLVGRQWCHAGLPDCVNCVLRDVCPKDIDRANNVRGG